MSRSGARSEPLDLERGLPTSPEDVAALRWLRETTWLTTEAYLQAMARLPSPSPQALRQRRGPSGDEPFRL